MMGRARAGRPRGIVELNRTPEQRTQVQQADHTFTFAGLTEAPGRQVYACLSTYLSAGQVTPSVTIGGVPATPIIRATTTRGSFQTNLGAGIYHAAVPNGTSLDVFYDGIVSTYDIMCSLVCLDRVEAPTVPVDTAAIQTLNSTAVLDLSADVERGGYVFGNFFGLAAQGVTVSTTGYDTITGFVGSKLIKQTETPRAIAVNYSSAPNSLFAGVTLSLR